jgi:hypothetical protein
VVLHNDSFIGIMMPFLVMFGAAAALLAALAFLAFRKFRAAAKAALAGLAGTGLYVLAVAAVSMLTPQTIVNVGDSYCFDIWCLGIDKVSLQTRGRDTFSRIDVHIFSDANHVKVSPRGFQSQYLRDALGRRFPVLHDPSVTPFDSILYPGQSIKTALTFSIDPDARQLFLILDRATRPSLLERLLYSGPFPQPTLFRVLWFYFGGCQSMI